MSTSSKARRAIGWATVLAAVALLFTPVEALTVRPARESGLIWAVRTTPGARFTLRWTHTVTLRPVEEEYEVGVDRLLHLRQMSFDQYGPNLPAGPEEGTVWRVEPDRWVVTGYQIHLERLHLGLSHIDHRLLIGGRELDLIRADQPNGSVRIQMERVPFILIIAMEEWPWQTSRQR